MDKDGSGRTDIAIVGPCAAGKSTLIARLKQEGFAARAISQEHSYVPYMWQMNRPDVLIYLDVTLDTLRQRRKSNWSAALLDEQNRRLLHARQHADFYLPTDDLSPDAVHQQVRGFLEGFAPEDRPQRDEPGLLSWFGDK